MRLLLVEDDEPLAQTISTALIAQNYVIDVATDGEEGWEYTQAFTYDLILLDVGLPKLDGIGLCQRLRQEGYSGPILLLTAKGASTDKVTGLDAGADDYVVKPCTVQELFARIRALLRRQSASGAPVLEWGELRLDPSSCECTYQGQLLSPSPKEYSLLELFLRYPRRVLSRTTILEHLWSFEDPPGEDTVRAHIKGLRRKLKAVGAEDVIETVYGLGYRLKPLSQNTTSKQQQTETAVARAWDRFKEPIRERLISLEQAVTALSADALTEELRQKAERDAHKLVGSLGMFGFVEGSRLAQEIENWLEEIGKIAPPSIADRQTPTMGEPQNVPALKSILARLRRELEQHPKSEDDRLAKGLLSVTETQLADQPETPLLLVVDDDLELVRQLQIEALNWQIRVEVALDVTQARAAIALQLPDVVLLDLCFSNAPREGLALLEELTQSHPGLPVLVFTARDGFSDRVAVARLGGRAFLPKPVTPAQVLEAVRDGLKRTKPLEAKVLAVDDDRLLLKILRRFLQPYGIELHTLKDPREFWEALEVTVPDLLILDVEMPHFNGIELCQVVRNDLTWGGLPIIFVTAHRDPKTIHRIYQAGADDYVSKPVTEPELVTRIFNRLERTQLLRSLAETDPLTGVANHLQATKELTRYLHLCDRYGQPLCFSLLDLDNFKQVNDQYGHVIGDRVLKRLGQILQQYFRSEDIVARWGGEEFAVGMYGLNKHDGVTRLFDVLQIVRQEVFPVSGTIQLRMTFSAGAAEYPEDGTDLQSLYRAADRALTRAKEAGRDRILPF